MKSSHRIALVATTLGLIAATAVPAFANAQTATTAQTNRRTSLMQGLVQRFHLSQTDVEQFFQDQKQQHQADAQSRVEQRLTSDVAAGKITEAQKSVLLAKAREAHTKHEEARKLSPKECKKMMAQYRTELEAWAKEQGISQSYLRDIMGGGPGSMGNHGRPRGGRPGRLHGMRQGTSQQQAPSEL